MHIWDNVVWPTISTYVNLYYLVISDNIGDYFHHPSMIIFGWFIIGFALVCHRQLCAENDLKLLVGCPCECDGKWLLV